jgi:hypothetical protein
MGSRRFGRRVRVGAALAIVVAAAAFFAHTWRSRAPDSAVLDDGAVGPRAMMRASPPPALPGTHADGEEGTVLAGLVTLDGRPGAGATITVVPAAAALEASRETVQAADDGRFSLRARDAARHVVTARLGDARTSVSVDLGAPDDRRRAANLHLELWTCARWAAGRVTDPDGTPLDARLLLESQEMSGWVTLDVLARTDSNGSFRICRDAGPVVATAEGHAARWVDFDQLSRTGRIELPPALRLAGRVVNEDGAPAPGATVIAASSYPEQRSRIWQAARADDDGGFEVPAMSPGCYLLGAKTDAGAAAPLQEVCGSPRQE